MAKEDGLDELEQGDAVHPASSDPLPGMLKRRSTDDLGRHHVRSPSEFGDSDWESEHNFLSTPPNELAVQEGKAEDKAVEKVEGKVDERKPPDMRDDDEFQTPPEEPREEARKFPHGPKGAGASKERPRTHAFWRKKWQHVGHESSDELLVPAPPPGGDPAPAPSSSSVPSIPENSEVVDV